MLVSLLLLSGGAVATAALAGAAKQAPGKPAAGASYVGGIDGESSLPVTFKVTRDGKAVTDVSIPHPLQCYLGRAYLPAVSSGSKSFPIERGMETFRVTLESKSTSATITLVLTGQFHQGGRESGEVSTTQAGYTPNPEFGSSCDSAGTVSGTYETKARPAHKRHKRHR